MKLQNDVELSLDEGIRWAEDEAKASKSEMRASIYNQISKWLTELKRHRMAGNAIISMQKRTIDVVSSKKATAEIGVSKSTMNLIKRGMADAGYHVVRDGNLIWMKPSEIEEYLLKERDAQSC